MGYRLVTTEQLGVIWAQIMIGESNRAMARRLGLDRGTVNVYATKIRALAIPAETPYTESSSYESFKRFVRERALCRGAVKPVSRIEVEPGAETQIDYAKMGTWPVGGRERVVSAFIGTLSFSRLPFVRFSTSQDQVSFASSIVAMLNFFGGSTRLINLDNLKAGVVGVDLYDPVLNRTFAELCEHYGIVADPARPASPKDKGKVERIVQVVRELWKRLAALHPGADLETLNELAATWAREEYGAHPHGTTGVPPMVAFENAERAALRALPAEPFVPATWSVAKVHQDQFIQVGKRLFGLPVALIGASVAVRSTLELVEIYADNRLVRSYPLSGKTRYYLPDDFPAHAEPFVPKAFALHLITQAGLIGPQAASYIRLILEQGGNLALRRAQACLGILEKERGNRGFSHVVGHAIAHRVVAPTTLSVLFAAESRQTTIPFPISPRGAAMGRDAGYHVGTIAQKPEGL